MKSWFTRITLVLALILVGCSDSEKSKKETVIARVDNTVLTDDEMYHEIGKNASVEQQREYVHRWLDRELLYQAAKEKKMHRDPAFVKKIEESERNLLSMAYLNQLVNTEAPEVTEKDIEEFFEKNRDQYLRKDDVIRYAVYSLKTVTSAWNVRKGLNADNFFQSSKRYSTGKTIPKKNLPFVQRSSLPAKLQNELFSIKEGGITTPIRQGEDVYLYLIVEKGKKGERATLAEVYPEVRNYLITSRYQAQIDSVMGELRAGSDYTFNHDYFTVSEDSQVSLRGNENE